MRNGASTFSPGASPFVFTHRGQLPTDLPATVEKLLLSAISVRLRSNRVPTIY